MINWINKDQKMPSPGQRVLAYSPCYKDMSNSHEMTYRLMDGQFVRISADVTHWAWITPPLSS